MSTTQPTFWERIKMEIKERFLNFETAKGVYLVPSGIITMYITVYQQQHVITALGLLFGWYLVSEGLRKIWVNRYKQARKEAEVVAQREALTNGGANEPNL